MKNNIILKFVDSSSIITDATACIGGNSYFFAKYFKFVNSIVLETFFHSLSECAYTEQI